MKRLKRLNDLYSNVNSDVIIKNIVCKLDEVREGYLFVCIATTNIERFKQVDEAIKKGAVAVVVDGDVGNFNVPVIKVNSIRREYSYLCDKFYDNPDHKIKMIGITGTEGKSSVGLIVQSLLGSDICGYIGNDFIKCNMFKESIDYLDVAHLYSNLDKFIKFDCKYAVVEASSVSLVNGLLEPVNFDISLYTNVSSDHLDLHGSFDNYLYAKMKLFEQTKGDGVKILNKDDIYFNTISKVCKDNYLTYGLDYDCDLRIVEYNCLYNKTSIKYKYKDKEVSIFSPLLGDFNVYNLTAALMICLELGYSFDELIRKIPNISIDEHMLFLKTNNLYKVMLDYAHTPNSILKLLSFVKSLEYSRIIVVIGQEGNRNVARRSHVGEMVVRNSDFVIFTSDNPGGEDPTKICNEMIVNVLDCSNYEIVINRNEAIKKAIDMADENEIVLILGKYDDSAAAYSAIAERNIREETF